MTAVDSFVLLRHASAGTKLLDVEADCARALDGIGLVSAVALPEAILEHCAPKELLSSPYVRCEQTLLPLAGLLQLPVRLDEALLPHASEPAVRALLDSLPGTSVLCTHGETLLHAFGLSCEKGGFWVVRRAGTRVVPDLYVPPPAPVARTLTLSH